MLRAIDLRKHLIGVVIVLGCLLWLSNSSRVVDSYNVKEVDVSGARELIDAGALVIDVRGKDQFDFRHIPGAVLITLDELRAGIPARIAAEAKDRQIVVYCNEGLVHGPEATAILNSAGYANAVNLKSGIEGWTAAGQAARPSSGVRLRLFPGLQGGQTAEVPADRDHEQHLLAESAPSREPAAGARP